ncbi:hypothetical protein ACFL1F_00530 [Chlamydiota bacterium]
MMIISIICIFFVGYPITFYEGIFFAFLLLVTFLAGFCVFICIDKDKVYVTSTIYKSKKSARVYFNDVKRFHCNSILFLHFYDIIGENHHFIFVNMFERHRELLQEILKRIPKEAHVDPKIYKQAGVEKT